MKDDLRSILRKGDPAAGEPGMTPEEVQAMRRTVLSAVPEPRRRGWLVPAMVGAAALVLAVFIAVSLWQPEDPSRVAVRPPAIQPPAVRPPLPPAGEGRGEGPVVQPEKKTPPQPSPASRERGPEPVPRKKKVVRPEPEPVVLARAEPPAAPASSTQIQFSTPGGTRVIWVLRPVTQ